ncbi:MAG: nucleotidyltransferase [Epulopiscium sp.]|nr:nucleotidyltransferase [Candidatus Epulonipiscium sp.]
MNIVGVVAEYNPFHNGHFYQLKKAKELTNSKYSVIVMSPNFVQRGGPAIIDKWARTRMALSNGADLVIELPTPYATASAEFFAQASVSLLDNCGIVSHINFGSESNNIELITKISRILLDEPREFKDLLKYHLDQGLSFPAARAKALSIYGPEIEETIGSPNNILAIEYIKALIKLKSNIIPTTIERLGSDYHSTSIIDHMPSATAIRSNVEVNNWQDIDKSMPSNCYKLLYENKDRLVSYKDLSDFLTYRLLFSSPNDLKEITGITEGMENRIFNAFSNNNSIEEIVKDSKSKRFTQTSIQRMLLSIILDIKKSDFEEFNSASGHHYIRVLGFKKSSAHLLGSLKRESKLPLVTNVAKDYNNLSPIGKKMLDLEILSSNLYFSLKNSKDSYNLDYTQPIIKI